MLRLLQLADSSFPTGGFSFSHGLEGLHALGLLNNESDIAGFAAVQIEENLAGVDLPAVRIAHRLAASGAIDNLIDLDRTLDALKTVPAFRTSSQRMGRRLLEMAVLLLGGPIPIALLAEIGGGKTPGHHAVAFAAVFHSAGVDESLAALAFAAAAVNGYVAASVRLGLIGQTAAQGIVAALQPRLAAAVERAASIEIDDLGAYSPLIDLAGMRQPLLPARMFSS